MFWTWRRSWMSDTFSFNAEKLIKLELPGVQEKLCFLLTIHCNPSLAYIAVRDLQSSQRNASVQSLIGW